MHAFSLYVNNRGSHLVYGLTGTKKKHQTIYNTEKNVWQKKNTKSPVRYSSDYGWNHLQHTRIAVEFAS